MRLFHHCALLVTAAIVFAMPAGATTDGVCFRPANVPEGDVLNLRAEPNANAEIVRALKPDTVGIIALIGECEHWCSVAVYAGDGYMRGWINKRYLRQSECP